MRGPLLGCSGPEQMSFKLSMASRTSGALERGRLRDFLEEEVWLPIGGMPAHSVLRPGACANIPQRS